MQILANAITATAPTSHNTSLPTHQHLGGSLPADPPEDVNDQNCSNQKFEHRFLLPSRFPW